MSHKAQSSSIDLLVSFLVFIIVFIFILQFWSVSIKSTQSNTRRTDMESFAVSFSDNLLKSNGVPYNWNNTNFNTIGLVSSQNILIPSKVSNFTSMSYDTLKQTFGIDYEFYFYVENLNGSRYYQIGNYTFGPQAVSLTRLALLNNEKVRVRLIVHG